MDDDGYKIIGFALALMGIVNVWLLFAVQMFRTELIALRTQDNELGKELSGVKVLVAGNYVTRDEFRQGMAIQTKTILDRMEDIVRRGSHGNSKDND